MPREALFNFVPLQRKKKVPLELTVKIQKPGIMIFNKWVLQNFGLDPDKSTFISLYCDPDKRAIGWYFHDTNHGELKKNCRKFKPFRNPKTPDYYTGTVSIATFLRSIPDVVLPTPHLKIKKYRQGLLGPELNYVKIPRGKQVEEDNEEQTDE